LVVRHLENKSTQIYIRMSFTNNKDSDNYITNKTEWKRIEKYIPKDKVIWAPFYCDGKQKEYFEEMGYNIIHEDKDFFSYSPEYDIVVDNAPFSLKKEVLTKLKKLDKPFILICPSLMLGYKYFQDYFKNDYLFEWRNERINDNTMSKRITKLFTKIASRPVNIQTIRRSYSSRTIKSNKVIDIVDDATNMLHSTTEHLNYQAE